MNILLEFGNPKRILKAEKRKLIFNNMIIIVTLLASIYYLIDFLLQRNKLEKLFFSLTSLSYGMIAYSFESSPLTWQLQYKIFYTGYLCLLIFAFSFLHMTFKHEFSGKIFNTVVGNLIIHASFVLILPVNWLLISFKWVDMVCNLSLLFLLTKTIQAFLARRENSLIILIGNVVVLITAITTATTSTLDINSIFNFNELGRELNSLSFIFWLSTFALILILLQLKADKKLVNRTDELALANNQILQLNTRLESENIRMEGALETTRRLQKMLLPSKEDLTLSSHIDINATMIPASEVGGDYYDVLWDDENTNEKEHNHFLIGIGDVTGHGLESSMLMLMTQMGLRTLLDSGKVEPKQLINLLNRSLYKNVTRMNANKTLTMGLLKYDFDEQNEQGNITYCGQHETLIVVRANGDIEEYDTVDLGFPLALEDDITQWLQTLELTLTVGDGIVLYTDGITEAENHKGELYGSTRFLACLKANWHRCANDIAQAVLSDIKGFVDTTIYDDVTLIVLKQR